jgi:hypothetical protein
MIHSWKLLWDIWKAVSTSWCRNQIRIIHFYLICLCVIACYIIYSSLKTKWTFWLFQIIKLEASPHEEELCIPPIQRKIQSNEKLVKFESWTIMSLQMLTFKSNEILNICIFSFCIWCSHLMFQHNLVSCNLLLIMILNSLI